MSYTLATQILFFSAHCFVGDQHVCTPASFLHGYSGNVTGGNGEFIGQIFHKWLDRIHQLLHISFGIHRCIHRLCWRNPPLHSDSIGCLSSRGHNCATKCAESVHVRMRRIDRGLITARLYQRWPNYCLRLSFY